MNTPVSFDIAMLLKEKGLDIEKPNFYNSRGQLNTDIEDFFIPRYEAPTTAEVVMWLYEKHGIWVDVSTIKWNFDDNTNRFAYHITVYIDNINSRFDYSSPTDAYGAAIEYTLKNLI